MVVAGALAATRAVHTPPTAQDGRRAMLGGGGGRGRTSGKRGAANQHDGPWLTFGLSAGQR